MASYEAGFIGAGNMGGALAVAAVKQVGGARVAVTCSTPEHTASTAARLDCRPETAENILANSRFVFLGVKPQAVSGVLAGLTEAVASSEAVLVSMLAGVTLERLADLLGADKKIIRIMPNTPCTVEEGLILYAANDRVSGEELDAFRGLMRAAGVLDELPEHLIDAASAVCVSLYRGAGGRRREVRPAPEQGYPLRRADASRQRGAGAPVRQAPGAFEGRGVQPRRQHHCRCGGTGGPWFPGGLHRRRGGGLQAHEGTWLKNGSNKNRGAGNLRCRDFLCTFIRYEPPASTGALQSR